MITIQGWVVQESPKAVLFVAANRMDNPVWLPKSQITIAPGEWDDVLTVPLWLAQSNGLRVLPPAPRGRAA